MRFHTIESEYEYRIANIVKELVTEYELDLESMSGDDLAQFLWEHKFDLAEKVHTDMFEWMSEDDWRKAVTAA